MSQTIITHSELDTFLCCRQKFDYRYNRCIVPKETPQTFLFGSAMHKCLEYIYNSMKSIDSIDNLNKELLFENALNSMYEVYALPESEMCKIYVLVKKYIEKYFDNDMQNMTVKEVEFEFCEPLRNPKTKRKIYNFQIAGKVDAIAEIDGELYIIEHKTTGMLSQGYLDRVDFDSQIALYALCVQHILKKPVVGAVYDIIKKPLIDIKLGETLEEFEVRKAQLLEKSKTGKTTAKRKEPESVKDFTQRLIDTIDNSYFVRKTVKFNPKQLLQYHAELIEKARELRGCKCFYKNTAECLKFGVCPYMELCQNNGKLEKDNDHYIKQKPHVELTLSDLL